MSDSVIVVGGGLAGLTCGLRAAELGLDVVVLEAGTEPSYLCNSRLAMGFFTVAFREMDDAPEILRAAAAAAGGGAADPQLLDMLANNALPAISWLRQQGVKIGRGAWRPSASHMLYPPAAVGAGLQWPGRGADQMLRRLEARLVARGGRLKRGARVVSLVTQSGRCRGVVFASAEGETELAADMVVLADGGFQADPDLLRAHITPDPSRILQRHARTARGDALKMAMQAGADTVGLDRFYGHIQSRDALYNNRLWPYPIADHLVTGGMLVNSAGARFADEGLGGIHLSNVIARLADPLSAFAIVDSDGWRRRARDFPLPANPLMVKHNATIRQAATIADLARLCDMPPRQLVATVEGYNAALAAAKPDGLSPPRSVSTHPAFPVCKPPFLAVPLVAGITYTMGGIRIDGTCQVLGKTGQPIDGLYAAGSATGGLEGGPNTGYTGGLSKALITGWTAANSIERAMA